ncbi:hypothetical protein [Escherichia phage B2]|uniref:Uncharacterized protein n=1 Tax=Escherichia phage B2 TaxID=2060112 RepID=A0A343S161_9CAUD|nr:hypothetical protein P9615_gp25 [Escherichia phage B2]AUG84590.1 hypothetical protein [Escherichia phage B2]
MPIQFFCIKQTGQKAGQNEAGQSGTAPLSPPVLPRVLADRDRRDKAQSFRLDGGYWPPSSETE